MSRPYVETLNVSYSNPTFSLDMEYLRLRGGGTFSLVGVSSSNVIFNVPYTYGTASENYNTVFKINVGRLNGAVTPGAVRLSGVTGPTGSYLYNASVYFAKLGGYDSFTFSA